MKNKPLLAALLMLTVSGMAKAETVRVGDGGETANSGLPSAVNWKYCVSQQIYTVEEISHRGCITAIAFKPVKGPAQTRTIDLYLTPADKTSFTDSSDWIRFNDSRKAFSGDVALTSGEWATVTLDKPFYYYGTQSLCVSVIDRTGSFIPGTSIDWLVYNSEKQSLVKYNDNSVYDPETMDFSMTGYFKAYKNQLQLTFAGEPGVVSIGGDGIGEIMDDCLPTCTCCKYELSEQIYTKEEIAGSGIITSIAFFNGVSVMESRSLDIYMVQTDKTSFASSTDVIPVSESDKVFSGTVTFAWNDWETIRLNTPFSYDGTSNLAVIVDDNTKRSERYELQFKVFDSSPYCSAYVYSNETNFDPANASSYSFVRKGYKNCIQLGIIRDSETNADFIDFETGNFSQFPFQNNGDYPWIVTNTDAAEGTYCMKSGNAGIASSSSIISATCTYEEDGYVCFDAKCMGEGVSWDKCIFCIDDKEQFTYGALGDYWAFYYYPVAQGKHSFRWEYTKDSIMNPDGDAFLVDNIRFLQGSSAEDFIVGLKDIKDSKDPKVIYNLSGQRLAKKQKGINIINRRKVLVK